MPGSAKESLGARRAVTTIGPRPRGAATGGRTRDPRRARPRPCSTLIRVCVFVSDRCAPVARQLIPEPSGSERTSADVKWNRQLTGLRLNHAGLARSLEWTQLGVAQTMQSSSPSCLTSNERWSRWEVVDADAAVGRGEVRLDEAGVAEGAQVFADAWLALPEHARELGEGGWLVREPRWSSCDSPLRPTIRPRCGVAA